MISNIGGCVMEKYLPLLQKSPLFAAMVPGQIQSVLHCVGATVREFGAGEYSRV